ncbi:24687_t:CDS:1, partial [Cetraspora pellucida]
MLPKRRLLSKKKINQPIRQPIFKRKNSIEKVAYDKPSESIRIKFMNDEFFKDKKVVFERNQIAVFVEDGETLEAIG